MKLSATAWHTHNDALYTYRETAAFSPIGGVGARFVPALLACVSGIGCLYQAVAEVRDRRTLPPPGRLVEVGGCRLHVNPAGKGRPTVVLESGLGGMSAGWGWIQPAVAQFSRVIAYDRAGLGWSEADHGPVSALATARRLMLLLRACGAEPPYILVGHSMGGLFIRVFADLFPHEVGGMVLVDAAHPDQHLRSPFIDRHMSTGFRMLKSVPLLALLGYIRITRFFHSWADGLPPQQVAEAEAFLSSYRHLKTTLDESRAWEAICGEVRATVGLGAKPLAVVTAGRDVLPGQPELQRELASLSSNSMHITVPRADHVTLVTHKRHALRVVQAIRHVVEGASRPRTS